MKHLNVNNPAVHLQKKYKPTFSKLHQLCQSNFNTFTELLFSHFFLKENPRFADVSEIMAVCYKK